MFEHIVLRRAVEGDPISAGLTAEALLYYQRVHLVLDRGTVLLLFRQIGVNGLMQLLDRPEVTAVFCEELLGTQTTKVGVCEAHQFVAMTFTGHQDTGRFKSPAESLQFDLHRHGVDKKVAQQLSTYILKNAPAKKLSSDHFIKGGIVAAAKSDLSDQVFIKRAIAEVMASVPGGYRVNENLNIEVIDTDLGFYVFTNIDLEKANRSRATAVPPIEPLTIAHILTCILDARADLALASFYGGDFVTSGATSSVIKVRHAEILRRTRLNEDSRSNFVEILLPDAPSLAEVIDSGERSFGEFLSLLDRAARFKDWLKSVNPDENLIRTYMRDITSEGWIQKVPAKSLRYVMTLALDATNPVAGMVSGLVDNFLVEKLFSGWKPNHFIAGKLAPFLIDPRR